MALVREKEQTGVVVVVVKPAEVGGGEEANYGKKKETPDEKVWRESLPSYTLLLGEEVWGESLQESLVGEGMEGAGD